MAESIPERTKALDVLGKVTSSFRGRNQREQLVAFYDSWAQDYEKDLKCVTYVGPEVGANTLVSFLMQRQIGTDCKILDVGAGTGLVGEELIKLNYTNLDALEPSKKGVEIATSKGIYKKFFAEFLYPGCRTSIPSDTYDAVIAIGVFTFGHVRPDGAMDEMVRVVKPGGLICFSIREDAYLDKEYQHEEKMAELCDKKAWKLLSKAEKSLTDHKQSYIYVYEVL